jgi:hypothetical protein
MNPSKTIFLMPLFIVFLTLTCSQDNNPIQPDFPEPDHELIIYALVIDSLLIAPGKEWIVFLDSTEIWPIQNRDTADIPELQLNTIENFNSQNFHHHPFNIPIKKSINTNFISWKKWSELGGWDGFYQNYPNSVGLIGFSRIGLNHTGDQAALYLAWNIHYLASAGYLIIFSKKEYWKIDQIEIVWIS